MKKYLLGIMAIVIAVGGSAFTKFVKKDKFACNDTRLIWYVVNVGQGNPAVSIGSTIALSKLDLSTSGFQYPDLNAAGTTTTGDGAITLNDFHSSGTFLNLRDPSAAASFTGCPNSGDYMCAVAFSVPTSSPSSAFVVSSGKIIPKSSAGTVTPVVACVIFRETE